MGRRARQGLKWGVAGAMATLIVPLAMAGCSKDPAPANAPPKVGIPHIEKPDIVIWLVDTLRSDHLGPYGYARPTSPRLDEFARDAVVYQNAYAPSSWTKPATASLLTGLNPHRHKTVGYYGRVSGTRLIGEYLKPLGYQTAAFSANPWILPRWGFGAGFDFFNPADKSLSDGRADKVAKAVLRHLGKDATRPFFCYVHAMDPHEGYDPPAPYDTMWGERLPRRATMGRWLRNPAPPVVEDLIKGYDGEIAFGDQHFGKVLDYLKQRSLYEDALIVFTADHGEEFFEHGHGGHGRTLFEESVRVPLLVKFPKNAEAGRRVSARVSLVDVLPTLLAYLERDQTVALDGVDLVKAIGEPGGSRSTRALFMQSDHVLGRGKSKPAERSVLAAVLMGRYKYVDQALPVARKMLFDIVSDPDERINVLGAEMTMGVEMAGLLSNYLVSSTPGIHFRNVNLIEKNNKPRNFRATFRTEGQFVRLKRYKFEAGDTAQIAENGKVLGLEITGTNRCDTQELRNRGWWMVDEDSVSFGVEPPDAKVVVEQYQCDASANIALRVGADRAPIKELPYAFTAETKKVIAEDVAGLLPTGVELSLRGPPGGYLAVVPAGAQASRAEVDQETRERLRSLGYVSD